MKRLLLLICFFFSGAASSNELWLKISEASKASHDLNYTGIINTTDSNQDIQSTKMIHVNHEGEEFLKIEKWVQLNIKTGSEVQYVGYQ